MRRGSGTAVVHMRSGELLRPRPLPSAGAVARVALVQPSATLLSGDRLRIDVRVGPGAALELVELAATVAHPVRGLAGATLEVALTVGAGARLHWDAKPLVLAAGCDLRRRIDADLGAGAVALLRDTLVLGRAGEAPGRLVSRVTAFLDGAPLHDEGLDTGSRPTLTSPAVVGDSRVLDSVALYGCRGEGPGVLQLGGSGTLAIACASDAASANRQIEPIQRAWARQVLGTSGGAIGERHDDGLRLALSPS